MTYEGEHTAGVDLLARLDKEYVWHPFTQMQDWMKSEPLIIQGGEGPYLIDVEGKRYIDGVSSLWVIVHGHGKREIIEAIERQAAALCHSTLLGLANVPSVLLARELVRIAPPGLSRVFYSDNGSTSVEIALKMAYQYWQHRGEKKRTRFLSFKNGYHGDTLGAVSVGGIDLFHKVYRPLLFRSPKAPSPYCYRCPLHLEPETCGMACVDAFEQQVKKHRDRLCAVIIEPAVQGAGGMLVQPEGFLRAIWRITREHGLLFIADEVATGFGRTGEMFACLGAGISPDFLCLSKGITGGYLPLAATLTTEEVFKGFLGEFADFKTFFHGHTYTGNPVSCAAAIASLQLFEKEGLLDRATAASDLMKARLQGFYDLSHVGDVRQKGCMVGIELVADRKKKRPYRPEEKVGQRVVLEARKRGVIVRPLGDVIVLMPPLATEDEVLEELLSVTYESIQAVTDER
jgi:adenosylmethionine-8-amino-7-oxononanoate aminotransferase